LEKKDHYQITNVVGAVLAVTEYSPVITWARQADRLAFGYYENGDYSVWSVNNPRRLMKEPYRDTTKTQAVAQQPRSGRPDAANRSNDPSMPNVIVSSTPRSALPPDTVTRATPPVTVAPTDTLLAPRVLANRDSVARDRSIYRGAAGVRASAELPNSTSGP